MTRSTGSFISRLRYLKYRFDEFRRHVRTDPSGHGRISFSQEGEDLLVAEFLHGRERGSYVDVGAHHPARFSNTYYFYQRGWRGLNIDATPGSMAPFRALRPDDINLECAVSDGADPLTFLVLDEPGMNTFDAALAERFCREYGRRIVRTEQIVPRRLEALLDEHWPAGRPIDFLSVDVEGVELAVLRSNNWDKYRPEIVLAENFSTTLEQLIDQPLSTFMKARGYGLVGRGLRTCFFRRGAA